MERDILDHLFFIFKMRYLVSYSKHFYICIECHERGYLSS